MNRSQIGYAGPTVIGADGHRVVENFGWNPGGIGCSGNCDGCYARKLAHRFAAVIAKCGTGKRVNLRGNWHTICTATRKDGTSYEWPVCEACATFEPHLHPERLDEPARRKTPILALTGFLCDLWDNERMRIPYDDSQALAEHPISRMLSAACDAPWHTYVWLTQQPQNVPPFNWGTASFRHCPNWYLGCTIRTQKDANDRLPAFLSIPGNLWISHEPARGHLDWQPHIDQPGRAMHGIIIGHDNRKGAPGTNTLENIRQCVSQCKDAGVNWFVKQIRHEGRLLQAKSPSDYAMYPLDLREGARLPWSAPKE